MLIVRSLQAHEPTEYPARVPCKYPVPYKHIMSSQYVCGECIIKLQTLIVPCLFLWLTQNIYRLKCLYILVLPVLHMQYRSLAKKGPWAVNITLCSDGGGWIFVTSLHFTTKKRPCLHYHNLQEDIAHQHTRPAQA